MTTGNGNYIVNLLKLAPMKKFVNTLQVKIYWRVLAVWNHCAKADNAAAATTVSPRRRRSHRCYSLARPPEIASRSVAPGEAWKNGGAGAGVGLNC